MRNLTAEEWILVSGGQETTIDEQGVTVYASRLTGNQFSTWRSYRNRNTTPPPADTGGGGAGDGPPETGELIPVKNDSSGNFDAEWASMMGPAAADSDRAEFFAKWFESASTKQLATLKGLVDALKNTLTQANKAGFGMTIANLNAMSNNLRDAISGAAPAANCGWSFGIDVSNLHREAPHDLTRLALWKAIMNLSPASRAGNI